MNTPFVLVIFGATGDLAMHKLIPDLFSLFKKNQLPQDFFIVGFARRTLSNKKFRELLYSTVILSNSKNLPRKEDPSAKPQDDKKLWDAFTSHLYYQQGVFEEKQGYTTLIDTFKGFDTKMQSCITRIFYLATPPQHYESILDFLASTKLSQGCGSPFAKASRDKQGGREFTRLAVEKPFGKDLETARALDQKLATIFDEKQIFRVDHYLGKETVQNLLIFRFANGLFEPVWNNEYIDHIQITFAESTSVGKRGKFYDGVGELRDIGQNHLMQLLAAVTMEMPKSFSKEDVRNARAKALKNIICLNTKEVATQVIRGQYSGYLEEKDVMNHSTTETFVATKFFVDSPKFSNVPFYVRAGKGLQESEVTISLVFRPTCHILFKEVGCPEEGNVLTFRIQPKEGIGLQMIAKTPGTKLGLQTVDMHFSYAEQFKIQGSDAYEKILLDIFTGDQLLFNRSDELESSWEFISSILQGWDTEKTPVYMYPKGSWGPKEADLLIEKDGRKWI